MLGLVAMVSATACVCLCGVAGLRLHLDAWLGLEDQPQPLPGQSLVVGYHDGDWLRHRAVPLDDDAGAVPL